MLDWSGPIKPVFEVLHTFAMLLPSIIAVALTFRVVYIYGMRERSVSVVLCLAMFLLSAAVVVFFTYNEISFLKTETKYIPCDL